MRGLGARCLVVQTDVTKPDQVDNLVERTMETFGKIDILVNNAGAFFKGSKIAEDLDFSAVQKGDGGEPDQRGPLLSPGAGLKMLDQGYGRIINIASVLGVVGGVPEDYSYAYSISKHGMVGLTQSPRPAMGQEGDHSQRHRPRLFRDRAHGVPLRRVRRPRPAHPHGSHGQARRAKDSPPLPSRRNFQLHHRSDHPRGRRLDGLVGGDYGEARPDPGQIEP